MSRVRLDNVAVAYYRELDALLKSYRKDVDDLIVPLVQRLAPETPVTIDSWVDDINQVLERLRIKWESQIGAFRQIATFWIQLAYNSEAAKVDIAIRTYRMDNVMQAAIAQNVTLIKSIPTQYHQQIENIVLGNMRQGMRSSYIIDALVKQYGVRERHARMIARDQTAKARGEIKKVQQIDAGYEFFKWETMHDSRVRHTHNELAQRDVGFGKGVYRWDDLPIVDGRPMQPGSDYQCRCYAKPIRRVDSIKGSHSS